uniref:Uncharacterized protein n=1 Tax=Corethron hystrix TaxID=216773 RepID=A0A6U5LC59_9STRA|mmetsp:Transcript_4902/g.9732  ORF Transcript_4902/g.9732 Transcript_4902/m.9732 type:complete len:562 (+) Transcript_4902:232-1917(+)
MYDCYIIFLFYFSARNNEQEEAINRSMKNIIRSGQSRRSTTPTHLMVLHFKPTTFVGLPYYTSYAFFFFLLVCTSLLCISVSAEEAYASCVEDMISADASNDGLLDTTEYPRFIELRTFGSVGVKSSFESLPLNFVGGFRYAACSSEESCRDSVKIDIDGNLQEREREYPTALLCAWVARLRQKYTPVPTETPFDNPSSEPTRSLTKGPTSRPSPSPSENPTKSPVDTPTAPPSMLPSNTPTGDPTPEPTQKPIQRPTKIPTESPTDAPTSHPTKNPTELPTEKPTKGPTKKPTKGPTEQPTPSPTRGPTNSPSRSPLDAPTKRPTAAPTESPSHMPSDDPTNHPTATPTEQPTTVPTETPTKRPTANPTKYPSNLPSISPTKPPTSKPTEAPSVNPVVPTPNPTNTPEGLVRIKLIYSLHNSVGVDAEGLLANELNLRNQLACAQGILTKDAVFTFNSLRRKRKMTTLSLSSSLSNASSSSLLSVERGKGRRFRRLARFDPTYSPRVDDALDKNGEIYSTFTGIHCGGRHMIPIFICNNLKFTFPSLLLLPSSYFQSIRL